MLFSGSSGDALDRGRDRPNRRASCLPLPCDSLRQNPTTFASVVLAAMVRSDT